jgi:hypothetical protein
MLENFINAKISYKGNSYAPLAHKEVIETVDEYLYKKGISVIEKKYNVAANGQKVIAKIKLDSISEELNQMLSWRNSLDGSMSFGVVAGTMVSICSNGMLFSDGFMYKRKHTGNAVEEILNSLKDSLHYIEDISEKYIKKVEIMKNIECSKYDMAELTGKLFIHEEIINSNQINIIKQQINHPEFDYKASESVWEFYNHCTYALKESHPLNWHKAHIDLGDFITNTYKI